MESVDNTHPIGVSADMTNPISESLCIGVGEVCGILKSNIDIADRVTSMGLPPSHSKAPAQFTAPLVIRLEQAGLRLIGRAKMHELAFGVTGINDPCGTPRNPLFPTLVPGGSSSGSAAAVAGRLCDFAIGTDTGGSVRVPAACCGVIGFKPTFGLIDRTGVHPRSSSLDCVGVFAHDMDLVIRVMDALIERFDYPSETQEFALGNLVVTADEDVRQAVDAALVRAGSPFEELELPGFAEADAAAKQLIAAEMWQEYGADRAVMNALSDTTRQRVETGRLVTDEDLQDIAAVRAQFTAAVDAALEEHSALVLPTLPIKPPTLDEARGPAFEALKLTALVRPFNLSGHPAISLPVVTDQPFPVGLQLIGRRGEDAQLCAIARRIHRTMIRSGEFADEYAR